MVVGLLGWIYKGVLLDIYMYVITPFPFTAISYGNGKNNTGGVSTLRTTPYRRSPFQRNEHQPFFIGNVNLKNIAPPTGGKYNISYKNIGPPAVRVGTT